MLDFMRDEKLWLKYFAKAWHIATENGMENPTYLNYEGANEINDKENELMSVKCTAFTKGNVGDFGRRDICKKSLMKFTPH